MDDPRIDRAVFSQLVESVGGDFVRELVATFADESAVMQAELRSAYARRDADGFRRAAHSVKSNAQTFGARTLADAARGLELGGLPSDSTGIDAVEAELAQSLARLVELAGD
jgi:HPt (histidine-containing phosphotransfer) domain-containing protein